MREGLFERHSYEFDDGCLTKPFFLLTAFIPLVQITKLLIYSVISSVENQKGAIAISIVQQ